MGFILTKLRSKRGMTLLETVVGMVIFSIIAVSVSMVLVPTSEVTAGAADLSENNTIMGRISAEIISDMKKATSMELISGVAGDTLKITVGVSSTSNYTIYYRVNGDGLLIKGSLPNNMRVVHDAGYYKGRTIKLEFFAPPVTSSSVALSAPPTGPLELPSSVIVRITLIRTSDNQDLLVRDYAVSPVAYSS